MGKLCVIVLRKGKEINSYYEGLYIKRVVYILVCIWFKCFYI